MENELVMPVGGGLAAFEVRGGRVRGERALEGRSLNQMLEL